MNQTAEARAEEAISYVEATANVAAEAIGRHMDLEADRSLQKDAAVRRLIASGAPNYSQAERTVESEPQYAAFLKELRMSVVDEEKAKGRAVAARLQAELAIARVQVLAGAQV